MNSIAEMPYWWCCGPWFEDRIDAVRAGYIHEFTPDSNKQYTCCSYPFHTYKKEDLIIEEKAHPEKNLTLVLIKTKCGTIKGTAIIYHKCY